VLSGQNQGMARFFAEFTDRHPSVTSVLRFLEFDHLSDPQLRNLSREFAFLGKTLLQVLPDDPELTAALNKLREAKDRAVGLAAVTRSEATE
jgi:hypothetical protein